MKCLVLSSLLSASLLLLGSTLAAQTPDIDLKNNPAATINTLNPALPTIFVAGDSTAARNNGNPIQGWGVPFAGYFDPAKVNVANRARGGRSSRTFVTEGLWDELLSELKAGDVVLIQFGHNDGGAINGEPPGSTRPVRARGSLPGLGEESQAIDNVITGKHEIVHTFGWYIRKMIADTQAKGALPIILSPTIRNIWQDGKVERDLGDYRRWDRMLAEAAKVPFVDVSRILADDYQALGQKQVAAFFPRDHTHSNAAGADFTAAAVVAGLNGLRDTKDFTCLLSRKGRGVPTDGIMGWLNLPEPANPALPTLFLVGDSTVRNGRGDGANGQWGWGDELARFFDPAKINVVNRAIGGMSSRTFFMQGPWQKALYLVKPGDTVVMQFGHNDNGPLNDTSRARGTIKGTGDETETILNLLTGQREVVHSYGWYLRQYIREAKAHGAHPVVCAPIPRKQWKDGHIVRNQAGYGGWAAQVAHDEGVPFIDLGELIAERYDQMGPARVEPLYADHHTHTSLEGAKLNAGIVAKALAGLPGDPLGDDFSAASTAK